MEEESPMGENAERITLVAPDISCGHCVAAINRAVGALPGVGSVDASEETKRVTVEYDPSRVALADIEATLDEEGYPVQT
jgi:copper chaperone